MGPQPKRCHHCKSTEHLIADCPNRRKSQEESEEAESSRTKTSGETSNGTDKHEVNDAVPAETNSNDVKD